MANEPTAPRWQRLVGRSLGPAPFSRQVQVHMCHVAADTFVAVSLAGSLFFSVSMDAARPRIILYLLLTMAPFAVVAPLIGPLIDRVRGGHRLVLAVACAGRVGLCVLMVRDLRNLFFYPEAFAVLVLGKTYSVAKSALVPRMVDGVEDLVAANSRLSRLGSVSGAIAGPVAVALAVLGGAELTLWAAACVYLLGAALALRLPRLPPPAPVPPGIQYEELHTPAVVADATAMAALRAAVGFLVFLLAFNLKRTGEPVWLFGLVVAAAAVGSFAGTFLAPWLRRRYAEDRLLSLALLAPGVLGLWAAATVDRVSMVAVVLVLGVAANVGSQAFSSRLQRNAPEADRGRAFATFETRFQLAWVGGALTPVLLDPPAWVGLLVLSLALLAVAGLHEAAIGRGRRLEHQGARSTARTRAMVFGVAVLEEARLVAARGDQGEALLMARAALRAASEVGTDEAVSGARLRVEDAWQRLLAQDGLTAEELASMIDDARGALDGALAQAATLGAAPPAR